MQINRLFKIVYILLDKERVSAKELAEQFEVSTRTIYRDIEVLSSAGIPVFMSKGRGGGISLLPHFVLNKTVLTQEEKNDILSSLQAVGAINFNETDSALQKLGTLFGENNTDWIEVDFSSWYNSEKSAEAFQSIKSAILSKRILRFSYASGRGERTMREVEPLRLCFKGMAQYLYGYCKLRQDYRFFKLNRIKDMECTDEHFERVLTGAVFHADTMFQEEYVSLKLRLSAQMAYRVYDEFEEYVQQPDGSFVVQIMYPRGEWVFPYISSFGSHCEVLEPEDIRDSFMEELKKISDNYL